MTSADNRKFRRLSTNLLVRIRTTRHTDTTIERMRDRIKNLSLGGVFIETTMPFEMGTHIELDFSVPGYSDPVHAKGIVKWSNADKRQGAPIGMGIEFLEVSTPSRAVIDQYVAATTIRELIEPLIKSTLHQKLLRFYYRKVGEQFPLDVLAQFLNCRHTELLEALRDFAALKIVSFSRDIISFTPAESREVTAAIEKWYSTMQHGDTPAGGVGPV